jgi:hypothetical protein
VSCHSLGRFRRFEHISGKISRLSQSLWERLTRPTKLISERSLHHTWPNQIPYASYQATFVIGKSPSLSNLNHLTALQGAHALAIRSTIHLPHQAPLLQSSSPAAPNPTLTTRFTKASLHSIEQPSTFSHCRASLPTSRRLHKRTKHSQHTCTKRETQFAAGTLLVSCSAL